MSERWAATCLYRENEARIRSTLRVLGRQQCIGVLSGNVWMLQNSPPEAEHLQHDMNTCFMRGWVEPLERAIPSWQALGGPAAPTIEEVGHRTFSRLTDSGWAVIHRMAPLAWVSFGIAVLSLAVAILSLVISMS